MPAPTQFEGEFTRTLEADHEQWPARHYRGRGADQSRTSFVSPEHDRYIGPSFGAHETLPKRRASGPKSYRRSDARIGEEVYERLASLGQVEDTRGVELEVKDAVVFLRGRVRDRRAKRMIEDEAAAVWGVDDVVNEIRIER